MIHTQFHLNKLWHKSTANSLENFSYNELGLKLMSWITYEVLKNQDHCYDMEVSLPFPGPGGLTGVSVVVAVAHWQLGWLVDSHMIKLGTGLEPATTWFESECLNYLATTAPFWWQLNVIGRQRWGRMEEWKGTKKKKKRREREGCQTGREKITREKKGKSVRERERHAGPPQVLEKKLITAHHSLVPCVCVYVCFCVCFAHIYTVHVCARDEWLISMGESGYPSHGTPLTTTDTSYWTPRYQNPHDLFDPLKLQSTHPNEPLDIWTYKASWTPSHLEPT